MPIEIIEGVRKFGPPGFTIRGIEELCFKIKYWWQRRTRGYDDLEVWNPYIYIARFAIPRLKAYRKNLHGHPVNLNSMEEWEAIIDKIILSLEEAVDDDNWVPVDQVERHQEGLNLFGEYFENLWD